MKSTRCFNEGAEELDLRTAVRGGSSLITNTFLTPSGLAAATIFAAALGGDVHSSKPQGSRSPRRMRAA